MKTKKRLKNNLWLGLSGIICILIFGYTLYEARFLIDGPELIIFYPKNNMTTNDSLLEIKGRVKNLSNLTINGRQIMITPDGLFSDKLLLLDGYNTIGIKVKNKFDQETSKILNIILLKPTASLRSFTRRGNT